VNTTLGTRAPQAKGLTVTPTISFSRRNLLDWVNYRF